MGNIGNLVGRDQKHQVGSIILAKILKMAPQRFLAYVREVKELPLFGLIMRKEGEGEMTALADINLSSIQQRIMTGRVQSRFPPSRFVRPVLLPNARYLRNKSRLLSPSVLAEIRLIRNNGPMVYYRNRALATRRRDPAGSRHGHPHRSRRQCRAAADCSDTAPDAHGPWHCPAPAAACSPGLR